MARMIALLRGINVGGHRKIPMADLRALAESLGFAGVETYIQSGNLVFTAADAPAVAAASLEKGIERRFGFPVDVVVRTAADWKRYARANPFRAASEAAPERVMILLTKEKPRKEGVAELADRAGAGEELAVAGDAVWVHYPEGAGRSKLTPALIDRLLGSPATARNWKTVRAIGERVGERGERGALAWDGE